MGTATWNGAPILGGFPSHFDQPGIVHVDYDNVGALVDTAMDASKKKIVHVKIADGTPEGLLVQVNRWTASAGNEYVNWKVSMHSPAGRPDINNCPTATMHAAEADCKATFGGMSPKMSCLLDYCFAGKEVALNK